MRLQLATSTEPVPDFLQLPFDTPLNDWPSELVIDIPTGVHRHPVRFVADGDRLFALKELPGSLAHHERVVLRHLAEAEIPVVTVVGVVDQRGDGLDDVLITRHLDFSLPFRLMFARSAMPQFRDVLIDAMAALLVRVHLAGFFWGDCSLSNMLFRRDAGSLSAFVVDVETGELHDRLSKGQRLHDLQITQTNVLGGLCDLEEAQGLPEGLDPVEVALALIDRYHALWAELTAVDVVATSERWRIDERLRRLNELGFDTEEIELIATDDQQVRFRPMVVEAGHHRRRLQRLTGIDAQENQARRLLNDMTSYRAYLEKKEGIVMADAMAASRWHTNVFQPSIDAVSPELADRRQPAELFHEVLAHRDHLRATTGEDIRVPDAAIDFAANVLPEQPSERTVLPTDDD